MPIQSNLAGLARVSYEAVGLADFRGDNDAAERSYVQATSHMSDSAVKLELASERLRRALAKGPSASREQARALLAVRAAEREVAVETGRATAQLDRQNRELTETRTRATAAGGALRSLRSGIAIASGGLLGTTGLLFGLRAVVNAAGEAETAEGRLEIAYRNSGVEFDRNADAVERALAARSRLSAFDDEDLSDSLAKVIVRTRDHGKALEALNDITDVARGRQISLEAATQLWIKASLGQAGQLRRVGIEVDKNATSEQLLAKLRQTYAGQAVQYANSERAARERANVSLENAGEIIGRSLTPAIAAGAHELSDWLDKQAKSGELQRNVNEAIETGSEVVRGLAGAFRIVKGAVDPVVDALGGVENTVKTLGVLWVGLKAKAILGFAGTALASRTTSAKMVVDATAAGRAWDIATRPRTMMVTTTTTGPPGPATPGPQGPGSPNVPIPIPGTRPRRGGRSVVERVGQYGRRIPNAVRALPGGLGPSLILGSFSFFATQGQGQAAYDPRSGKFFLVVNGERAGELTEELVQRYDPALWARTAGQRAASTISGAVGRVARSFGNATVTGERGASDVTGFSRSGGGTSGAGARRTTADIRLDISRALTTPETTDEERLYREQISRYQADIRMFERRKSLTNQQKQTLERLYGDLGAAQSALDSIREQREQGLADQQETARARRKEQRENAAAKKRAADARERAQIERAYRDDLIDAGASIRNPNLVAGTGGRRRSTISRPGRGAAATNDPSVITRDELGVIFRDFMAAIVASESRSSVAGGSISTHVLESLTREQTNVLRDAVTRPRMGSRGLDEAIFG